MIELLKEIGIVLLLILLPATIVIVTYIIPKWVERKTKLSIGTQYMILSVIVTMVIVIAVITIEYGSITNYIETELIKDMSTLGKYISTLGKELVEEIIGLLIDMTVVFIVSPGVIIIAGSSGLILTWLGEKLYIDISKYVCVIVSLIATALAIYFAVGKDIDVLKSGGYVEDTPFLILILVIFFIFIELLVAISVIWDQLTEKE